jgi:hypothetical protein
MVVPLRDSGVRDSAFLPGMPFGPTTVDICGCLYPSAGPTNLENRGAERANDFGLVVTYQESGKGSFNLLSVKTCVRSIPRYFDNLRHYGGSMERDGIVYFSLYSRLETKR